MKRFLKKQLLNMIFLALIVGGALTIYFLSRAEHAKEPSDAAESAGAVTVSSASPSPAAAVSAAPRAQGVPESVFTTHLSTSSLFEAAVSPDDPCLWTLVYGESPPVTTTLQYTVDYGAVSSLELAFQLPPEYDEKSESAIEQYLANSENRTRAAREEAVRTLLTDLLPACDLNYALSRASVRIWTEEALKISSEDDDYSQKSDGCTFYAYQMQQEGRDILVCLLFFEP